MKSLIAVVVTLLTLAKPVPHLSDLMAQETVPAAKIVLNAQSSARVGELVRLDASESDADSFKWLLNPETVDFEVYAEGTKAVFSARTSGTFMFILAVAKNGTVDVVTHTLTIIGPPDNPTDILDIHGHVKYWLWPLQVDRQDRLNLADAFERVARMGLSEPQAWIYETKRAIDDALGDSKPQWEDFLKKIGGYMQDLGNAGEMIEPEDHARVWLEIADALREGL